MSPQQDHAAETLQREGDQPVPLGKQAKALIAEWDGGLALKKWMIPDQYAKYLQLDKKQEPELYVLFEPLFLVPLIPPWRAQRDAKSRVYFQHVGVLPEDKKVFSGFFG